MAYGQGFAGGYADDALVAHPGGGGGSSARYRIEPWTAPRPPVAPYKPEPVRLRVAMHGTWSATVRVTGVAGMLHDLDRRAREAQELAEIALALEVWR